MEVLGNKVSLISLSQTAQQERHKDERNTETKDDWYASDEGIDVSDEDSDDDEKILEPLTLVDPEPIQYIRYVPRGPIPNDPEDFRYKPYGRTYRPNETNGQVPQVTQNLAPQNPPSTHNTKSPKVLIITKSDTKNPKDLDLSIKWSARQELSIDRSQLPEDAFFEEDCPKDKIKLFLQLNPGQQELKAFYADVKLGKDGVTKWVGPIVISLKTDLEESEDLNLVDMITKEEMAEAEILVAKKEIESLVAGVGKQKDSVLAVLSAQKHMTGQTLAQIQAVTNRLIKHPDKKVKNTIFKLNSNQISAFEIASVTNNSLVASYLAKVMYNLIDDTSEALATLNSRDVQGNTIIHLLARKGDKNLETLRGLLSMRLADQTNSRVFRVDVPNAKKQLPIHIAAQSAKNQAGTIALLHGAMPRSLAVADDDGMTPLHYACQRTSDVLLVQTILSYRKDNINARRKDGLTALDLVSGRSGDPSQAPPRFSIDPVTRNKIIECLENNGGKYCFATPGQVDINNSNTPCHSAACGNNGHGATVNRMQGQDRGGNQGQDRGGMAGYMAGTQGNTGGSGHVQPGPSNVHCMQGTDGTEVPMSGTLKMSFINLNYTVDSPYSSSNSTDSPYNSNGSPYNSSNSSPSPAQNKMADFGPSHSTGSLHRGMSNSSSTSMEEVAVSMIMTEFPQIENVLSFLENGRQ